MILLPKTGFRDPLADFIHNKHHQAVDHSGKQVYGCAEAVHTLAHTDPVSEGADDMPLLSQWIKKGAVKKQPKKSEIH